MEELEKVLSLIIELKGFSLNNFIQKIEGDKFDETVLSEEAIIQVVHLQLTAHNFQIYSCTFHQFILANVHKELDA